MQATYSIISLALLGGVLALAAETPADKGAESALRSNLTEEMHLITKSLEDLLGELAVIKREATGRLSNVKNRASSTSDQERIRQTKVSRFVLKRVAELELESQGMRDDMAKLLKISANKPSAAMYHGQAKQEDFDFDSEPATSTTARQQSASPASQLPASSSEGMPATSTLKPEDEAAKIGFDIEALKKLGDQLESEIGARQQQNPESLRGVHEQVIKLVDNMVNNYLGNVRRAVQRMTNLLDNTRGSRPRESPESTGSQDSANFYNTRQAILTDMESLQARFNEFTVQWSQLVGRQQSPLIDRIPPRGVELWRDFWDTCRKQVRRINQEFWQLSQDMTRMLTGRLPNSGTSVHISTGDRESLFYVDSGDQITNQFQAFYVKMSAVLGQEQEKMDKLNKIVHQATVNEPADNKQEVNSLYDEQDDEMTRNELNRNPALRQQIQQEINIFGSIFDIMGAFIQRLRESASNAVRGVIQPGSSNNNNNDPVTPGPSVKPQVDKLLGETINSQRDINSQAKPVLLPNVRPVLNPKV